MGTKNEKVAKLEKVIKAINSDKKYRDDKENSDIVIGLINSMSANVETINTGSLVIDNVLGGGFAKGRIVEIFGQESSGKTSIAISGVANCQRNGGTAVYIDAENAFDPNYAKALGVNLEELFFAQPTTAEQALDLVSDLTDSGMVDLIVVDSVAALVPRAELEGDASDHTIGLLARLMSKQLKKLTGSASRRGTTIIFINQTRDKIGGFSPMGTPKTTPGGAALKFYASQRLEVKKGKVITGKNQDDVIGTEIGVVNKKNKIAPPFRKGSTVISYAKGINMAAEMIEVGPSFGVVIRPNNRRYETFDGQLIGTSKDEAVRRLESDKELFSLLHSKLEEVLKGVSLGHPNLNTNNNNDDNENNENNVEE